MIVRFILFVFVSAFVDADFILVIINYMVILQHYTDVDLFVFILFKIKSDGSGGRSTWYNSGSAEAVGTSKEVVDDSESIRVVPERVISTNELEGEGRERR